nr:MAG TPA: PROTEIN/RNA Complex, archaeal, ribosomal, 50S, protein.0A [Caudoviricetes sp.]
MPCVCNDALHQDNRLTMDYCVICGAIVPEGRWVCPQCERRWPEF